MTDNEDSCGKTVCKSTGACIFGTIWEIVACPFVSCFKCTKYTCNKCCCKCCKCCKNTQDE